MCGIGGWFGVRIPKKLIRKAFLELQDRGRDATGIAFLKENGDFGVYKAPIPASSFVFNSYYSRILREASQSKVVLLHCRAATNGSPQNNKNNHPIWNNQGIIVHNGIVSPVSSKKKPRGDTDTEKLMLAIQERGFEALRRTGGSYAFCYIDKIKRKGWLIRRWAPLYAGRIGDGFVFGSTRQIVRILASTMWIMELEEELLYETDFKGTLREKEKIEYEFDERRYYVRVRGFEPYKEGNSPYIWDNYPYMLE